jgi:hypothetical protein
MIVRDGISIDELKRLAEERFGDLVKAVVDIERELMAVGAELHADDEAALLGDGSRQVSLWGINLYPAEHGSADWIEFDSMINVRPGQGNRTRSVDDPSIREQIVLIVGRLVRK